jgi:hypothetical protein
MRGSGSGSKRKKKVTSMGALKESRVLKQWHISQSIDHALNSFKGSWQTPVIISTTHIH